MSTFRVFVVCRNILEDRIIPRMARYLKEFLGWDAGPFSLYKDGAYDCLYLAGYYEAQKIMKPWPSRPSAAYMTHREDGGAKAELFDAVSHAVDLRITTCDLYRQVCAAQGPTTQVLAPLDRRMFVPSGQHTSPGISHGRPVVGLSGYTYQSNRKGESLLSDLLAGPLGKSLAWRASGRGWPVPTKQYPWVDMPLYYQSLDLLLVTSLIEGIPMPPLEALSCGIPVVIPRGVGLHDELPDIPGIYRYDKGSLSSLIETMDLALDSPRPDPNTLHNAVSHYSVESWVSGIRAAVASLMPVSPGIEDAISSLVLPSIVQTHSPMVSAPSVNEIDPIDPSIVVDHSHSPRSIQPTSRGVFMVSFGQPARACARRLISSIQKHMPDIPIAVVSSSRVLTEDIIITSIPDTDVGGRRAKLSAYDLTPPEWKSILYLDADTEVVAPIYQYFEWIESGWEFVITKDPHLMDTMFSYQRRNNVEELSGIKKRIGTLHALMYNGGVWSFARNERVRNFFLRWREEWEIHAQRDQGALIAAMYSDPLHILVLGSEWNTFPKYTAGITTAGLMHYPGDARRWKGMIPGRIDSPEAWAMVQTLEDTGAINQKVVDINNRIIEGLEQSRP